MSYRLSGGRARVRLAALSLTVTALLLSLVAAGCGQAAPEETVYKFLGAVQAHDYSAMRSCINPEALSKAEESEGEPARQWEELYRKYLVEPVNWRMEFEGISLKSSYLDPFSALVRLAGGRCRLYNLKEGAWVPEGEIDFSREDFSPLYVVLKDGQWYLEALDLYIVYGLENAARI
jgi:hypothetical protein